MVKKAIMITLDTRIIDVLDKQHINKSSYINDMLLQNLNIDSSESEHVKIKEEVK